MDAPVRYYFMYPFSVDSVPGTFVKLSSDRPTGYVVEIELQMYKDSIIFRLTIYQKHSNVPLRFPRDSITLRPH